MEQNLIVKKLASLRRCLFRAQTRCPATQEGLLFDPDAQDIVSLNLMRAFQLTVESGRFIVGKTKGLVPTTASATFEQLQGVGIMTLKSLPKRSIIGLANNRQKVRESLVTLSHSATSPVLGQLPVKNLRVCATIRHL